LDGYENIKEESPAARLASSYILECRDIDECVKYDGVVCTKQNEQCMNTL